MNNPGPNSFEKLQASLRETLSIIDEELPYLASNKDNPTAKGTSNVVHIEETHSLLDQCNEICEKFEANNKPRIRIFHHLACSGGTLISKCISAQPNVFLLSEVHPFTTIHLNADKPPFAPSDLTSLSRYANIPHIDEYARREFLSAVKLADTHIRKYGGALVLRDHSHSDFCVGQSKRNECGLTSVLKDDFEILSVISIRDPIDSYLSLTKNNWRHFTPESFNEYCKRVLNFLAAYKDHKVFLYEDFVANPMDVLNQLCAELDLPFREESIDIFDVFKVSGDSGRSGSTISQRERLKLDTSVESEIRRSKNYRLIADRFGYQL
jgi:hypothetical protein